MLASNLLSCRPACCNSTSVVPEVSCTLDALHVFPGHLCGKGGVALLPEELARADEGRGVLELPAHHVGPLVQAQRQVPVAADPLRASRRRTIKEAPEMAEQALRAPFRGAQWVKLHACKCGSQLLSEPASSI